MSVHRLTRAVRTLQRSQLSVQALGRLSSVYVFLLASWWDGGHLALVALQGVLFAIPYTLVEAFIGRPMSAGLVPAHWSVERWAVRAAVASVPAVAVVSYVSATVGLPHSSPVDRLVMISSVLIQMPLEALFWAAARTRSRTVANLIPQLTSAGTFLSGAVFAVLHLRMDAAAVPAQVAVLVWALARRPADAPGQRRPTLWQSLRIGMAYCVAAGVDLVYSVALPSIAGRIVGPGALVVLRSMELAFGPFHVALAATAREDIVGGRDSRLLTGTRVFTVVLLLGVSAAVLGSEWVRRALSADLAATGTTAVALYCGYKAAMMLSTWASIRHMIWAQPRRYLVSAVGSRVLAFAGLLVSLIWVRHVVGLFTQLLIVEVEVVVWYLIRIQGTPRDAPSAAEPPRSPAPPSPASARLPRVPPADFTRRALLTRGGAFATGAGAVLIGGAAATVAVRGDDSTPAGESAQTAFNVRHFGAVGDGRTDDTDTLQKAISAAREHGGTVFFPPGTYLTRRLTLYSGVHLRGAGGDATVLRQAKGANGPILESDGFARLTGSRSSGGITMFSIRDLTLDGNKKQNPAGGYGLRVYGYGYELTEVVIFDCHDDGMYSEWGNAGALPAPSHQMEARLTAVRTHDNGGHGINFAGPHDSMLLNCLSVQNGGSGFRFSGDGAGTSVVNCHAWGIDQQLAFDLAASAINCASCYADFNGGVGVRISRNDCRWVGGLVTGSNHGPDEPEIGIQFQAGDQPNEPAGVVVDAKVMNCGTAAVDFSGDRGISSVRAVMSQPGITDADGTVLRGTGLGWLGTPHPTTQVELTDGLGNTAKNLVVRPAFDLRAQAAPPPPDAGAARVFSRVVNGKTQLCVRFPNGTVSVLASE